MDPARIPAATHWTTEVTEVTEVRRGGEEGEPRMNTDGHGWGKGVNREWPHFREGATARHARMDAIGARKEVAVRSAVDEPGRRPIGPGRHRSSHFQVGVCAGAGRCDPGRRPVGTGRYACGSHFRVGVPTRSRTCAPRNAQSELGATSLRFPSSKTVGPTQPRRPHNSPPPLRSLRSLRLFPQPLPIRVHPCVPRRSVFAKAGSSVVLPPRTSVTSATSVVRLAEAGGRAGSIRGSSPLSLT